MAKGNPSGSVGTIARKGMKPVGRCDYSGFTFLKEDLIPQMQYNGANLYDTGFLVYRGYADKPQAQYLAPTPKQDPVPINNPRIDTQMLATAGMVTFNLNGLARFDISDPTTPQAQEFMQSVAVVLEGSPSGSPVTIIIPPCMLQFQCDNRTDASVLWCFPNLELEGLIVQAGQSVFITANNYGSINVTPTPLGVSL